MLMERSIVKEGRTGGGCNTGVLREGWVEDKYDL